MGCSQRRESCTYRQQRPSLSCNPDAEDSSLNGGLFRSFNSTGKIWIIIRIGRKLYIIFIWLYLLDILLTCRNGSVFFFFLNKNVSDIVKLGSKKLILRKFSYYIFFFFFFSITCISRYYSNWNYILKLALLMRANSTTTYIWDLREREKENPARQDHGNFKR